MPNGEKRRTPANRPVPDATTRHARGTDPTERGTQPEDRGLQTKAPAKRATPSQLAKGPPRRSTAPRFGQDGAIPPALRGVVVSAFEVLWQLADRPEVTGRFAEVVGILSGRKVTGDAYPSALARIVVHLADTSHNTMVRRLRASEDAAAAASEFQPSPAFSFPGRPDVWVRRSTLGLGVLNLVATLLHESMHVAGVPANQFVEGPMNAVLAAAGVPVPRARPNDPLLSWPPPRAAQPAGRQAPETKR